MTRPKKERKIQMSPVILGLKPWGLPSRAIEWVSLSLDEYEAIRLVDLIGLSHQEAAEKMGISRPTLTRLLESGHKKIAESIVYGKGIFFQMPEHISISKQRYFCSECDSWQPEPLCPECGMENLVSWKEMYTKANMHRFRRGKRRRGWI